MAKLLFAWIGKDRTVWCFAEAPADEEGDGPRPSGASNTKTATKVLAKLQNDGKYNFNLDGGRAAYAVVERGVCFGCIVMSSVTAYTAMSFINEVKTKFFVRQSHGNSKSVIVRIARVRARQTD